MAMLVHEIWQDIGDDGGVLPTLCLASPDGEAHRKLLHKGARCIDSFKASSDFEAMTIYYRHYGWGAYITDFDRDHAPHPDDWAKRQSTGTD